MSESSKLPVSQTCSVVVVGDFNPAILQPYWFSSNGLIALEQAQAADVEIIHKQASAFTINNLRVAVDVSKMAMFAQASSLSPTLRDLALGTLLILEHVPLVAIGFNLELRFSLESKEDWHAFGDRLVPKNDWSSVLENPGMRLVIVHGKRANCLADRVEFRVEPTSEINFGVQISMNQHYALTGTDVRDTRIRNARAIRILEEDWLPFMRFATESSLKLLFPTESEST